MAALRSGTPASLADQAYDLLEEQLVSLALPPGTRLREKTLGELTGLGRTPVREAVQRLAAQGLLQVMPRKGLRVTPIRRRDLERVLEARRVLERLLVVKAAERATPDQRLALRSLAGHLERMGDDLTAFLRFDRRLDELLASACANPYLVQALAPLHCHCRRLWIGQGSRPEASGSIGMHAALARAVADNDSAGAVRATNGILGMLDGLVAALEPVG